MATGDGKQPTSRTALSAPPDAWREGAALHGNGGWGIWWFTDRGHPRTAAAADAAVSLDAAVAQEQDRAHQRNAAGHDLRHKAQGRLTKAEAQDVHNGPL